MLETRPVRDPSIQLCGNLVLEVGGRRCEAELPSRQGRLLFASLVVNRHRPMARHEAAAAVWPDEAPESALRSLSALLSKLRKVLGCDALPTGDALRLVLPGTAFVDLEAALDGLHRAESAVAQGDGYTAYGPSQLALHVAERGFLVGLDAEWVQAQRRALETLLLGALEVTARTGLLIGGTELGMAERAARRLVEAAPFRETGFQLLMRALERSGNPAEALRVYEACRTLLRDELGAHPGPDLRAEHERLLTASR
jgi:DNA-binding SARP family transcriptional activator